MDTPPQTRFTFAKEKTFMEIVKQNVMLERTAIFSKAGNQRFEYTMQRREADGKKILVICTNPASGSLLVVDTTTNYLMNNLFSMGYVTVTLCNLFAEVTEKLHPVKAEDNADNMEYIKEVLKREFDEILLGFGSGFAGSKRVNAEKANLYKLLNTAPYRCCYPKASRCTLYSRGQGTKTLR